MESLMQHPEVIPVLVEAILGLIGCLGLATARHNELLKGIGGSLLGTALVLAIVTVIYNVSTHHATILDVIIVVVVGIVAILMGRLVGARFAHLGRGWSSPDSA